MFHKTNKALLLLLMGAIFFTLSMQSGKAIVLQDPYTSTKGGYSFKYRSDWTATNTGCSKTGAKVTPNKLTKALSVKGATYKIYTERVRSAGDKITDWNQYISDYTKSYGDLPYIISYSIRDYPLGDYTATEISTYQKVLFNPYDASSDTGIRNSVKHILLTKDFVKVYSIYSELQYSKNNAVKNPYTTEFRTLAKSFRIK